MWKTYENKMSIWHHLYEKPHKYISIVQYDKTMVLQCICITRNLLKSVLNSLLYWPEMDIAKTNKFEWKMNHNKIWPLNQRDMESLSIIIHRRQCVALELLIAMFTYDIYYLEYIRIYAIKYFGFWKCV